MELLRKALSLFDDRKERRELAILSLYMLVGAIFETIGIGLIMPYIGLIADPTLLVRNVKIAKVYSWTGSTSHSQFVIVCGLLLILFYVAKNLFLGFLSFYQNKIVFRKHVKISKGLLSSYIFQPYAFHLNRNSAELLRVLGEVGTVFQGVLLPLLAVLTELLVLLFLGVLLCSIEPVQTLVAVSVLGGITGLFYRSIKKNLKEFGLQQQRHSGLMIKWVNQGLGGIKETKVLGREKFFLNQYVENVEQYTEATRYAQTVGQFPKLFIETIAVAGIVLMVCILLWEKRPVATILPTLGLFAMAAVRLMPSMSRIVSNLALMRFCKPSLDAIQHDLHLIPTSASISQLPGGGSTKLRTVRLQDLYFRYPGAAEWALEGIDLDIEQGEAIALIGSSGAGKTTLVDVILGLLDPTSGRVLVNDQPISSNLAAWRSQIGYIPQSIYLSDDSLRRNIAFGVPDENISDEQVWAALRAAQLEDFVIGQPQRLETLVGERGVRLSGGQRQRIGIARALYHDPEVLILDEATSSLDNETEREVSSAIERLSGKKTVILIAHRLTTARKCSRILQLQNGKIARAGTYDEVIGNA